MIEKIIFDSHTTEQEEINEPILETEMISFPKGSPQRNLNGNDLSTISQNKNIDFEQSNGNFLHPGKKHIKKNSMYFENSNSNNVPEFPQKLSPACYCDKNILNGFGTDLKTANSFINKPINPNNSMGIFINPGKISNCIN